MARSVGISSGTSSLCPRWVAVYNGEYRGGTAATIRYAQKLGRRVIVLDPNAINQSDLNTGNYLNVVVKND